MTNKMRLVKIKIFSAASASALETSYETWRKTLNEEAWIAPPVSLSTPFTICVSYTDG